MNLRHFTRRPPKKSDGFAFGRFPADNGESVTYRLFRRDHSKRTHVESRTFFADTPRSDIARSLWHARIQLRESVDFLYFQAEGLVMELAA